MWAPAIGSLRANLVSIAAYRVYAIEAVKSATAIEARWVGVALEIVDILEVEDEFAVSVTAEIVSS